MMSSVHHSSPKTTKTCPQTYAPRILPLFQCPMCNLQRPICNKPFPALLLQPTTDDHRRPPRSVQNAPAVDQSNPACLCLCATGSASALPLCATGSASTLLPMGNNSILPQIPCAKFPPRKTLVFPRKTPCLLSFPELKTSKTHPATPTQKIVKHRKTPPQTTLVPPKCSTIRAQQFPRSPVKSST
jgi:hypothetical protein